MLRSSTDGAASIHPLSFAGEGERALPSKRKFCSILQPSSNHGRTGLQAGLVTWNLFQDQNWTELRFWMVSKHCTPSFSEEIWCQRSSRSRSSRAARSLAATVGGRPAIGGDRQVGQAAAQDWVDGCLVDGTILFELRRSLFWLTEF